MHLTKRLRDPRLKKCLAVSNAPVWAGQAGRNYNALNVERAADVEIVRIFIEDDPSNIDVVTQQMIDDQVAVKIAVYIARRADIPQDLCHGLAIFDNTTYMSLDMVEGTATAGASQPARQWRIDISAEPADVRRAIQDFETIRAVAQRVVDPNGQ
jgi:hypothetical protein